jgi:hypothetical protein
VIYHLPVPLAVPEHHSARTVQSVAVATQGQQAGSQLNAGSIPLASLPSLSSIGWHCQWAGGFSCGGGRPPAQNAVSGGRMYSNWPQLSSCTGVGSKCASSQSSSGSSLYLTPSAHDSGEGLRSCSSGSKSTPFGEPLLGQPFGLVHPSGSRGAAGGSGTCGIGEASGGWFGGGNSNSRDSFQVSVSSQH